MQVELATVLQAAMVYEVPSVWIRQGWKIEASENSGIESGERTMSGIFFNYVPGRIDARFRHGAWDSIILRIRMRDAVVTQTPCDDAFRLGKPINWRAHRVDCSVEMTSVFCPFGDFVRFLEAIAVQVQECAFGWDAEGPEGRMSWQRGYINRDGTLTVSWEGSYNRHRQDFRYSMRLDTRQTVRMLYGAFRRFVESSAYDPLRYESSCFSDALELVLTDGARDEFASVLIALSGEDAERLVSAVREFAHQRRGERVTLYQRQTMNQLMKCAQGLVVGDWPDGIEPEARWIDGEWDGWSASERLAYIREQLFNFGLGGWDGKKLRALRSPLIESWLARPVSSASA